MTTPTLANAVIRTESEALADRLKPMTAEQVATLTDDRLFDLERRARLARLRIECRDDCLTAAEYEAMKDYTALETIAGAEIRARNARKVAAATLRTLGGIGKMLGVDAGGV